MARLIKLTLTTGKQFLLNPDYIVKVQFGMGPTSTLITLDRDGEVFVKEDMEFILDVINRSI